MMKVLLRHLGKLVLLAVPMFLGLFGFIFVEGHPLLQSLFNCICMYCLNYQEEPLNIWIEVARWLAPLATASGVVLAVRHFKVALRNLRAYWTGHSVAVFGPEEERAVLLEELGRSGIPMDEKPVKAHQYILLGSEQENLDFYQNHRSYLKDHDVYIKCRELPAQASTDSKLHLFCPEETAARYFWKTYCPYQLSVENHHRFRITMIGFGKLGKELLLSALQNNIFHRDQRIEYHVIGEEKGFRSIYSQLHELSDSVFFHSEPWYEKMELIRESEMLIVTEISDQLSVLRDMSLVHYGKPIHLLAAKQEGIRLLADQNSWVHVFDWKESARKKDAILSFVLYDRAMRVNLRYAHLYNGVAETPENRLQQWSLLDTFTRYANIRSADYHDVRENMIRVNGWSFPLDKAQMEELAELEHIRWCRYHFLNNWKQGNPENGKAKDPAARIHRSLVPYEKLCEEEKEKDRQVIDILFSLS